MRDVPALRVLVVDDEPLARELLMGLLANMEGVEAVGECADGVEAAQAIEDLRPDLVLLDVQMPEVDGFAVIERVGPERMPDVVFVTAFEQHTLRAFEVHALDYIVKPFEPERLVGAVERARVRRARGASVDLPERLRTLMEQLEARARGGSGYARRLTVREGEAVRFVPLEEVDWLEADGNYVRVHAGEEEHLVRTSLRALLPQLDPATFLRIHRSAVVNLDRVRDLRPWFGADYMLTLRNGRELRVGRRYRDELLRLLH